MPYDSPTSIDFTSGFGGMFNYLNAVTSSWFSNLLLISIYILFATGFYFARRDFFGAMAVGGFATFIIALLFWIGGLISGVTFAFVVAVAIIGFASLWIGGKS
jgi:hypothetical protein